MLQNNPGSSEGAEPETDTDHNESSNTGNCVLMHKHWKALTVLGQNPENRLYSHEMMPIS